MEILSQISPLSFFSISLSQMRLALTAIVVLLGANLVVDLLDSNLSDVINNRRETIEINESMMMC